MFSSHCVHALRFLIGLMGLASSVEPVGAQDATGRWTGRMEPKNLSAEIRLDLQRSGSAWKGELAFRAGPSGGTLPVLELRVAGDSVFVLSKIEGADLTFRFVLDDRLLLGSASVSENGRVLADGPAGLAQASDSSAQARLVSWFDARIASIDAAQRSLVVNRTAELLLANYVHPDRARRAVTDLRARSDRGEFDAVSSPARLAELLGRHLAEATGDRHVQLKISGEPVPDPRNSRSETTAERAELRNQAIAEQYGIGEPKVLEGNVGYLEFTRFFRAEDAGDALAAAMRTLASTDALIIDLRETHGGDPVMVVLAASWLFEGRPRLWNEIHRRFDRSTTQFWTAAWLPGQRYGVKPVYVLTARRTFSAPEGLAYELQQTRRATIIGETTGGAANTGSWFPIDGRFALFIPLSRYVSAASGGDWEGVGVKPDVPCPAAEALQCAHRLALRGLGRR